MASEREMETATVPRSQLVSIVQLWRWQTDARVRNEEDALRLAREKVADMERSALQPTPEATHLREVNAALVGALREAQSALALMVSPDAIRQSTVSHAYAQLTVAEAKARAALARATTQEQAP